jgi:hypothetical protein
MPLPTDPTMQPQAGAAMEAAEPQSTGYRICIDVGADNSLSVGVENEAAEMAPGADPMAAEQAESAGMKPAANIKEALTQALAIFKANGKVSDEQSADAEFDSGYNDRGGSGLLA